MTSRTSMLSQNSNSTEFYVPLTDPHTFGRPRPPRVNLVIIACLQFTLLRAEEIRTSDLESQCQELEV